MIKVTVNEKQQIVTTCDTCEEHALIMASFMFKFSQGDIRLMAMISLTMATLQTEDEIKNLFKDMPLQPHEEGMRNFFIDTVILSKDTTTPLGKPSNNNGGLKKLLDMAMPTIEKLEQTPPKPRFNI